MKRLFFNTSKFDSDIGLATNIIQSGGIVVFPTSSIYGLACNSMCSDSVKKIFAIKKRSLNKPISVIIPSIAELSSVAKFVSNQSLTLMEKFWPGKVTFIIEACNKFPSILTAGTGKIGVRVPLNNIAKSLAKNCEFPITATSANVSGEPGVYRIDDINYKILNAVDLVINAGSLPGGLASTVVDMTVDPIRVLREGKFSISDFN